MCIFRVSITQQPFVLVLLPLLQGDLFPHHPEGDLRVVKLAAFEGELWKTLEADLLFVVGTLLSNKAREKAQVCARV